MTKLLKADEAAAVLRVSMPTLYQMAKRDGFPALWIGNSVLRIPEDLLLEWITNQAKGAVC